MKKGFLLIILISLFFTSVNGQGWAFKKISGSGIETACNVLRDEAGNTYVTGTFSDTLSVGNLTSITAGNFDVYVACYSSTGSLKWLKTYGGNSADYIYDAVYKNGVIYCGGAFLSATINLQVAVLNNASGNGGYTDSYILALDTSGNFIWGNAFGSQGAFMDQANDLEVTDNALYVAGSFEGSFNAGNGVVGGSSGATDAYFLKFGLSGNALWGKFGNGIKSDYGLSIAVDRFGYVYCAGSFGNSSGLGSFSIFIGSYQLVAAGSFGFSDLFIAKYDTAGTFYYARRDGGGNPDIVRKLVVKDGTVLLGGNYYYETNLGGAIYVTNGGYEGFVLAYDTALTPQWSQVFTYSQGTSYSDDNFLGIDSDNGGNFIAFVQHAPFKQSLYYLDASGNILSSNDLVSAHNASYGGGLYVDGSCSSVYAAAGFTDSVSAGGSTLYGAYGDVYLGIRTDTSLTLDAPANITSAVPDSICASYPLFTVGVDTVAGAIQYSWQIEPQQAGSISGTGNSAVVDIDNTFSGVARIFCFGSSGCSVSPSSDTVEIHVESVPPAPTINTNGLTLIASIAAPSYQWYFNGNLLPGQNGNSITATTNGSYQVAAVNNGCASDLSAGVFITNVGADLLEIAYDIVLYPNPVKDLICLQNKQARKLNIAVSDLSGKTVLISETTATQQALDLELLPPSIYIVRIANEREVLGYFRIIKL